MKKPVNEDPFAYYFSRGKDGYDWVQGRLVDFSDVGTKMVGGELPQGTFLEFANLSPDAEHIRRFANRYSDLFECYGLESVVVRKGMARGGLTLAAWAAEIEDMRVLVAIWHATQDPKRRVELKKIITWKSGDVRYSITTPRRAMRLGSFGNRRFARGEVLLPARHALQNEVNRRLKDPEMSVTPRLVWTQQNDKQDPHGPATDWKMRIVLTPPNLLGALWLQFAQAVAGNYCLRPCKHCGKSFIVGPGGRRADAKTCTNTCKSQFSKAKQVKLRARRGGENTR